MLLCHMQNNPQTRNYYIMRIIAGAFRNRRLQAPKGLSTRPTPEALREALFNICQHRIEGARILDLFSGSGALALEAISRGAASAVCVDRDRNAQRCIQENISAMDVADQVRLIRREVFATISQLERNAPPFDIIFADPPYADMVTVDDHEVSVAQHLLNTLDISTILAAHGWLFLERAHDQSIDTTELKQLQLVSSRRFGSSALEQFTTTTASKQ
ncbi:Putative rRNA methyltransferase YlbH [Chlamydiales bacterium SCGC AG-110-P3]|nr:Putative rRNA methyltransferase YlbH [Chlamydiales bacterium SCGC AG-110-P3]